MNWSFASACSMGLILTGRLGATSIRSEALVEPYNRMLLLYKEGASKEDIIMRIGLEPYNSCLDAIHNMNGAGEADWPRMLEESFALYQAGRKMEKWSQKLQRGENIKWEELQALTANAQLKLSDDLVPLSQIESGEVPFVETGWEAFDVHTGGFPETGLIVVGGRPGVGKTTFMTQIVSSFATKHEDKNIAVFSIEMVFQEIAARFRCVNKKMTKKTESRIYICEKPMMADEIIASASSIENLGLIAIDFADLMIRGDTTESSMSQIYRTLMLGAKALHIPIMLLSQLNRASNGLPRMSDFRWTGLAEALGWMLLMLYNPASDWSADEDSKTTGLPITTDDHGNPLAYIAVWKVRGGFRKHPDACPGAIQIPFNGKLGWHPTSSKWFSLQKIA